MYNRQCSTELDAWREVAGIRKKGLMATDPIPVLAPNQRDTVWAYSAEINLTD